jgi:catechol 2,3-dioxygenase-like lactoylglutathione lyase family enzyme
MGQLQRMSAQSKTPHCYGGLFEVCVGVPDLDAAIAYFRSFGCDLGARGVLAAHDAQAVYGVDSALESVRLTHGTADHGFVRLMHWSTPLNAGLGMATHLRCVGSRWGTRLTTNVLNIANHAQAARAAGETIEIVDPLLDVIGEVTGTQAARPFLDPIVGVREMVVIQPHYRQVFFQRFGYDSPLYGTVDPQSLLATSQHTHFGLMIANDAHDVFEFYDGVLGLKRWMDAATTYEKSSGGRRIYALEPGEGFHIVDFDDPRSGHTAADRRSGKLKCIRLAGNAKIDRRLSQSRAGCLGYSAYTWRVDDAPAMWARVRAAGATNVSEVQPDEFGALAFSFNAPDGYYWILTEAAARP